MSQCPQAGLSVCQGARATSSAEQVSAAQLARSARSISSRFQTVTSGACHRPPTHSPTDQHRKPKFPSPATCPARHGRGGRAGHGGGESASSAIVMSRSTRGPRVSGTLWIQWIGTREAAARSPFPETSDQQLFTRPTVDDFTKQISMPIVARVLLDHVRENPSQAVRVTGWPTRTDSIERLIRLDKLTGTSTFLLPQPNRLLSIRLLDLEVGVVSGILAPVQERRFLTRQNPREPGQFHVGQMPNQSEERKRRRRHRPPPKLFRSKPGTLPRQRLPLELQEPGKRLVLSGDLSWFTALVRLHPAIMPVRSGHRVPLSIRGPPTGAGRGPDELAPWECVCRKGYGEVRCESL